jgi:hypothetical protein
MSDPENCSPFVDFLLFALLFELLMFELGATFLATDDGRMRLLGMLFNADEVFFHK